MTKRLLIDSRRAKAEKMNEIAHRNVPQRAGRRRGHVLPPSTLPPGSGLGRAAPPASARQLRDELRAPVQSPTTFRANMRNVKRKPAARGRTSRKIPR